MQSTVLACEECLIRAFAGDKHALLFFGRSVPPEELTPVSLELGSGHRVVLAMRDCAIVETLDGMTFFTWEYWAIRVYVAGDEYDDRLRRCFEFREGIEFERTHVADVWAWLEELAASRMVYQFNDVYDLIDHLCDHLAHHFSVEDMFDHFDRLPGLYIPSIFDQWDDSLSNDQEDFNL